MSFRPAGFSDSEYDSEDSDMMIGPYTATRNRRDMGGAGDPGPGVRPFLIS
jgi:hypothetical protein